jgi:hypothetical protein
MDSHLLVGCEIPDSHPPAPFLAFVGPFPTQRERGSLATITAYAKRKGWSSTKPRAQP